MRSAATRGEAAPSRPPVPHTSAILSGPSLAASALDPTPRSLLCSSSPFHGHPLWKEDTGLLAAIVVGQMTDIEATAAEIRAELGAHAHLISFPLNRFEGMGGMVVRAPGRSKGTALQAIGSHLGIDVNEMVAIGDWFNDAPMFQVAGRSFAMKSAPEEVRALASDHVRCELTEGGVAEVIDRVFG